MHIDHINISAPIELLITVKDFYCDILGFTDGPRPKSTIQGFWLYSGEHALLHLAESTEHYKNDKQGYLDHVAFQTTGLKHIVGKLNEKYIPFSHYYFSEVNKTQIFFKDPAGTGIEINFLNESL